MSVDGFEFVRSVFMSTLIIGLVIGLIWYVFYSIGLYAIAKRRELHYPGLAWVPVANLWLLGKVADQYDLICKAKNMKLRHILLWGGIVAYIISIIYLGTFLQFFFSMDFLRFDPGAWMSFSFGQTPLYILNFIVGIAFAVFTYIALYKLYRSCSPDSAVTMLVLSILFGITTPFFVFAIRNNDKGVLMHKKLPDSAS